MSAPTVEELRRDAAPRWAGCGHIQPHTNVVRCHVSGCESEYCDPDCLEASRCDDCDRITCRDHLKQLPKLGRDVNGEGWYVCQSCEKERKSDEAAEREVCAGLYPVLKLELSRLLAELENGKMPPREEVAETLHRAALRLEVA